MSLENSDLLTNVLDYHERTKHQPQRYARSPGYLDWATQPNPFRRFPGTELVRLAHPPLADQPRYDDLFAGCALAPQPVDFFTISRLFYDSLAISAWKRAPGTEPWSLRINPSSGDLHPTEGYLLCGPIEGLSTAPAVLHYTPYEHALERRAELPADVWSTIAQALPAPTVLIGLCSIYWRESWKYGERAFRYCHHDVGHAIGTLTVAAATLGWCTRLVTGLSHGLLGGLLGTDRQSGPEAEHPDCVLALFPASSSPPASAHLDLDDAVTARLRSIDWAGSENRLSGDHRPWPVIDIASAATRPTGVRSFSAGPPLTAEPGPEAEARSTLGRERPLSAQAVIRRRRSAVAMDGATHLERDLFFHILQRLTPQSGAFPFAVLPWQPAISLALFVHRVRGLESGLYMLVRHPDHRASLQQSLSPEIEWKRPRGCPPDLDFSLLLSGDWRDAARQISCHQDIAADGCFSLGMLARYEKTLRRVGPSAYPHLFWECGLIGQVLYLEAEAAGVRATGIGCFFDDLMHRVLGIADRSWQSLYHFTVGGAVEDTRLQTLPPYHHLVAAESAPTRRPGGEG